MEVRNKNFAAFIDTFTTNTYIMIIMSDLTIQPASILINIELSRNYFEKFIQTNVDKDSSTSSTIY
jgi:Ras-related GTP-binding protein A/B